KGQILRLPSGATVVDFAYAVHTDIGNRCVAAKVDRRLTPLRTVLRNGQTVEIITAKGATPNPSWVNFVVTAKGRSAIRHYLKGLRRKEAIALGSKLLAQALGEFSVSFDDVGEDVRKAALGELGMKDLDELHEKLGLGERLAPLVARRLLPGTVPANVAGGAAPLAIAGTETNIDHVSIGEQDGDTAALTFELRVRDRRHLAGLVRVIRRMADVTRVTRTIAAHARTDRRGDAEADADADSSG